MTKIKSQKIKSYLPAVVNELQRAIEMDQFDDSAQQANRKSSGIQSTLIDFVDRNLLRVMNEDNYTLDLGCGSGRLLSNDKLNDRITHMMDASPDMLRRLQEQHADYLEQRNNRSRPIIITQGFAETLSSEADLHGDADEGETDSEEPLRYRNIFFLNGFFQVRSDYEALVAINWALYKHGRFIVNIYTDDSEDIISGRVYGPRNFQRVVESFGFSLIERRDLDKQSYFCFEKMRHFEARMMTKLQLVPVATAVVDEKTGKPSETLYVLRNFDKNNPAHYTLL